MTGPSTPEATAQDAQDVEWLERENDDWEFPPNAVKVFIDYDEDPLRVDGDVLFVKANSVCIPVADLPEVLGGIAEVAGVAPDIAAAARVEGLRDGLSAALAAAEGHPDADGLLAEVLRELRAVTESSQAVAVLAEALYGDRDRSGDHTVVTLAQEAAPLIRVGRQQKTYRDEDGAELFCPRCGASDAEGYTREVLDS